MAAPTCVICTGPVEAWPGPAPTKGERGYGNNPEPWPSKPEDRACRWCNEHIVIPVRLRRVSVMQSRGPDGRSGIVDGSTTASSIKQ